MFHLLWYLLIGLISGVIAKSVMHVHLTIFWTSVVGVIGSVIGGAVRSVPVSRSQWRIAGSGLNVHSCSI